MIKEVTIDHIIENASYYRQLLAEEGILVFKYLNVPVDFYDLNNEPHREGHQISETEWFAKKEAWADYPYRSIMWSFFCDFDLAHTAINREEPLTSSDPVGVTTGQYHSFLLNWEEEQQPKARGPENIVGNWHKDHYHYPTPTSLIAMNMHTFTCAAGMGDTVIVNLMDAYDDCPQHILDYLQDGSYIYTDVCGCEDPPLSEEHPTFATHPVTGRTSLCYPGRDGGGMLACMPSDGSVEQWQEYEDWMWEYMNAPENQFRMKWEEGDFLIWDNRSCIHNYMGGWELDERIFDRYCIGKEAPFFDPLGRLLTPDK